MKWAGYILSFYLLLLTAVPCCQFDDCSEDQSSAQTPQHPREEKQSGSCSPFFSCQGCASIIISSEPVCATAIFFPEKPAYSQFVSPFIETVHFDFWQPPQLI
jgi:hypothetical protein